MEVKDERPHLSTSLYDLYPCEGPAPSIFGPKGCTTDDTTCSPDDIAQGVHPDCFFIASCIALGYAAPSKLKNLFVGDTNIRPSRAPDETVTSELQIATEPFTFTVQFWQEKSWQQVSVEPRVAMALNGSGPQFVRSPTGKWWPLLLEAAFAKHYGTYDAIRGGNIAEVLRDLTAQPVLSYSPPLESEWLPLARALRAKTSCAVAGTRQAFKRDVGLQLRHAYAVVGIVEPDAGGRWKDALIVLRNPNSSGPAFSGLPKLSSEALAAVLRNCGALLREGVFAFPLSQFDEFFNSLHVCELCAPSPSVIDLDWTESGGSSAYGSFNKNPMYVLSRLPRSSTGGSMMDDVVWITLTHRDQRRGCDTTRISYEPCGFTVLKTSDPSLPLPICCKELACRSLFPVSGTPAFRNQRDVSIKLAMGSNECLMIIPSSHTPSRLVPKLLSFCSREGTTALELVPSLGDSGVISASSLIKADHLSAGSAYFVCKITTSATNELSRCVLWILVSQPSEGMENGTAGLLYLSAHIDDDDIRSSAIAVNYTRVATASKEFLLTDGSREVKVRISCPKRTRDLKGSEHVLVSSILQPLHNDTSCVSTISLIEQSLTTESSCHNSHGLKENRQPQTPSRPAGGVRAPNRQPRAKIAPPTVLSKAIKSTRSVAAMYAGFE